MMGNFFEEQNIEDWGYSYKKRIFTKQGLNYLADNLQKHKNSTRSIFTLLSPAEDAVHVPCLTQIQAMIRDKRLILKTDVIYYQK